MSHYELLLKGGTEDPRLLKEIREFLNDNDINISSLSDDTELESNEAVELDDDYLNGYQIAK
jgi:hypothetical protein